uniref:Homing endonuclease n=1 Tax=Rhizobium phage IG49 TaxID=3129228 RepID=A0AAU8HZ40_9CAUD
MKVENDLRFIDNKWKKIYFQLVEKRKKEVLHRKDGYVEKHHVLPKSFGGDNSKENVIAFTAREHFILHRLLVRFTEGKWENKMRCALLMLGTSNGKRGVLSSRDYENARKEFSRMPSPQKGKPLTEFQKERFTRKGKKNSPETRLAISNARKNVKLSEEHKKKIGESLKGIPKSEKAKANMKGKRVLTEEEKSHLSNLRKGKKRSSEVIKRSVENRIYTPLSDRDKVLGLVTKNKRRSIGYYDWSKSEQEEYLKTEDKILKPGDEKWLKETPSLKRSGNLPKWQKTLSELIKETSTNESANL